MQEARTEQPDAGPRSGPRRHARADSQEDQERRSVRRLPRGVPNGWQQVKLYFLCGLPGERAVDLDGIVEMAETIARIGKEVSGPYAEVTASVSNFVPKPHTPYQWNGMQTATISTGPTGTCGTGSSCGP